MQPLMTGLKMEINTALYHLGNEGAESKNRRGLDRWEPRCPTRRRKSL